MRSSVRPSLIWASVRIARARPASWFARFSSNSAWMRAPERIARRTKCRRRELDLGVLAQRLQDLAEPIRVAVRRAQRRDVRPADAVRGSVSGNPRRNERREICERSAVRRLRDLLDRLRVLRLRLCDRSENLGRPLVAVLVNDCDQVRDRVVNRFLKSSQALLGDLDVLVDLLHLGQLRCWLVFLERLRELHAFLICCAFAFASQSTKARCSHSPVLHEAPVRLRDLIERIPATRRRRLMSSRRPAVSTVVMCLSFSSRFFAAHLGYQLDTRNSGGERSRAISGGGGCTPQVR